MKQEVLSDSRQLFQTLISSCEIIQCSLKEKTCSSEYKGSDLKMDGFKIYGTSNKIEGWQDSVCIECRNER